MERKIDKSLTAFSYAMCFLSFFLLMTTKVPGEICLEGFWVSALALFARDFYGFLKRRKYLEENGFEYSK